VTPSPPLRHRPLRLNLLLERMAAPQLIRVADRYAPGEDARAIQRARQTVEAALDDPRRLDALVASLTGLERYALGEVQRGGGLVNAWTLMSGARARGLKAGRPARLELYRHHAPARFEGAEYVWPLLADGLLLPLTLPMPFMESHGRGLDLGSPLLSADERLLARLPDFPRPGLALPLKGGEAGPLQGSPPQLAPFQLIQLRLQEMLRALGAAGGLTLTKSGDPHQAALKRLQRGLPALPGLRLWLEVALQLGLLAEEDEGKALRPASAAGERVRGDSGRLSRELALIYPGLDPELEGETFNLAHLGGLRAALLGLLAALPRPVSEEELAALLEGVTPPELRQPSWKGRAETWRDWLAGALGDTLEPLGLVSRSADGRTVGPSPGLLGPASSGEALRREEGAAWVVQPNFELLVYPARLGEAEFRVLTAAQALRLDPFTASFLLTRESVYAALEGGLGLEELLRGLEAGSATPLPAGVRTTLEGWAARRERLVLHAAVTLLEFGSAGERGRHLREHGGRPVGERLLLQAEQKPPAGSTVLRYDAEPAKSIRALPDGRLKVTGALDFVARGLLDQHAGLEGGTYTLRPPSRGEQLPVGLLRELEARLQGPLPALLRLQLGVWSGQQPAVGVAQVSVMQHPQAAVLATHPRLAPLVQAGLGPGLLLLHPGQEQALREELARLGLPAADTLQPLAEGGVPVSYEFPEDTRRKRALLEQAVAEGREVGLMYQQETYNGWYNESRPGRTRQGVFRPLGVLRQGSTPYLRVETIEGAEEETIRIGYVLGIALR